MKIYEVTWYDAHFHSGDLNEKNIENETKPYIIKDVGYYVGQNSIDFKIAQEIHEHGGYSHIMSIPHKMIIKKRIIK